MSSFVPDVGDPVSVAEQGTGVVQEVAGENVVVLMPDGLTVTVPMEDLEYGPYLTFECEDCKQDVHLTDRLDPGSAAVLNCPNCGESWTAVQPSLEVYRTREYEPIWKHIAQ